MNFYPFHIGDYASHTTHLTNEEDIAYRRMIDLYYMNEHPFNDCSTLARRIRSTVEVVQIILDEFFELQDDGYWHNSRIDKEIARYQGIQNKKSQAGKASAVARTKLNTCSTSVEPTKNQEPLPRTILKAESAKAPKAQRLKLDSIPEDWFNFCRSERPDLNPKDIWDQFKDYWSSIGGAKGTKLDWFATWRNWVRNQRVVPKTAHDRKMQTLAGLTGGIHGSSSDAEFKPITELQTIDMEQSNANLLR